MHRFVGLFLYVVVSLALVSCQESPSVDSDPTDSDVPTDDEPGGDVPEDPKSLGPFNSTSVVYAPSGLTYPSPELDVYQVFETPSIGWETRELDLSVFGPVEYTSVLPWPFDATNVPINGVARLPDGPGPFPLALIAHGKKSSAQLVNSTLGFDYLLELLSSHGIIAASVDQNFYQEAHADPDSRAILLLEHALQFQRWNEEEGHPLFGQVDTSRVMFVGHSRGGEAVEHTSNFNRLSSVSVLVTPKNGGDPVPQDVHWTAPKLWARTTSVCVRSWRWLPLRGTGCQ